MNTLTKGKAKVGSLNMSGVDFNPTQLAPHYRQVALATATTGGGIASVANPLGVTLIVERLFVDATTASGTTCTADFGIASGATTSADNLIDGLDLSVAALSDNLEDKGTNGKSRQLWPPGSFLTGSKATGTPGALAGLMTVQYVLETATV